MSADGYTVTVRLGDWTSEVDQAEDVAAQLAAGAVVMDGLSSSWSADVEAFPAQPAPQTLSMALYVPDLATGPTVYQGQQLAVTITGPGWDSDHPPFFEFYGRVSDPEAEPLATGMRYDLVAVDYTADLAEERIGDTPWPAAAPWPAGGDPLDCRVGRVFAASALPLTFDPSDDPGGAYVGGLLARDVDSQPTSDVVEDTLRDAVYWYSGAPTDGIRWPLGRWFRPILCQHVDPATGQLVDYRLGFIGKGIESDAARPFRLATDPAGGVRLVDKPAPTPADPVVIVTAAAVERSVRWRQDKARHTNRIRLAGTFHATLGDTNPDTAVSEVVREWPVSVAERGAVEQRQDCAASWVNDAHLVAAAYLGETYDTIPRWAFDEVVLRPQLLGDDAAWPRLFPPAAAHEAPALGRFFLLTDVPAAWNLYHRPDFPGRLVGATVELRRGVFRVTARILHSIPFPNGIDVDGFDGGDAGLTVDDLAAVGDPTPADFHDLTALDLRLTDSPS